MLSVGATHFEDRFCASRKGGTEGGGCHPRSDRVWQLLQLAVEKPWSAAGGPFFCIPTQTGLARAPFLALVAALVGRNVLWSEGPDNHN